MAKCPRGFCTGGAVMNDCILAVRSSRCTAIVLLEIVRVDSVRGYDVRRPWWLKKQETGRHRSGLSELSPWDGTVSNGRYH
jgi:hypothetical protein